MPLREMLQKDLISCSPESTVLEVCDVMKTKNVGAVLVVDHQKKPIGIVTDRDVVIRGLCEKLDLEKTTVRQIMSDSVATVHGDDGIQNVISVMKKYQVRRIPVVDHNGAAIGLVSFGDIFGLLAKEMSELSHDTPYRVAA